MVAGALRAALDPSSLDPEARDELARTYARRAFELGLTYLAPSGPRAIPPAFPPVFEPRAVTRDRSAVAHAITAALMTTARAILEGRLGDALPEALLAELDPVERALVRASFRDVTRLATVRVDTFVDAAGVSRVLEVNATIPAMQGYSDVAARAFLEAAATVIGGLSADEASERAQRALAPFPTNADDLLGSLVACYRGGGGAAATPSIALLHRPLDSQLGELRHLAASFRARGHDARLVEAQDMALDPRGRALVAGAGAGAFLPDLLYRHVFARRVDPAWPLAEILRSPRSHHLYNPVDPHLEQKSLLAEVSQAACVPEFAARAGLDPAACALVRRHVPWTRRLAPGPTTGPGGEEVPDLVAHVRARRDALVLKRSWDFGGKGVFLGREHGDEGSLSRTRDRFGRPLGWDELADACAAEGGWVVQERVPLATRALWIASEDGARRADVFVDVSAYTSAGVDAQPSGGVCRASGSPIVNIQSGGGVVPLLPAELLSGE